MQEMVNIFIFGKKYSVPGDLTIMTAMEYAGYQLKRGCGCRHLSGMSDSGGRRHVHCQPSVLSDR